MNKFLIALTLLAAATVTAQTKPSPTAFTEIRPALSDAQKVAIYRTQRDVTVALEKLKATPEYKAFSAAQDAQVAAIQDAVKGVDQKKWVLQDDLEFHAVVPTEKK